MPICSHVERSGISSGNEQSCPERVALESAHVMPLQGGQAGKTGAPGAPGLKLALGAKSWDCAGQILAGSGSPRGRLWPEVGKRFPTIV